MVPLNGFVCLWAKNAQAYVAQQRYIGILKAADTGIRGPNSDRHIGLEVDRQTLVYKVADECRGIS